MKTVWTVRKGSAFPVLGAAFALIALAFSILVVCLTNALYFSLPELSATSGGELAALVELILTASSALILLAVCTGYGLGISAKSLILPAAMLIADGLCRFGVDLYTTLFVAHQPFYPFSTAHVELIASLLLLLCVILTVCGRIRSVIPTVVLGFLCGLGVAAVSVLRVGAFGSSAEIDLSGMLFYTCYCVSIALCSLALERGAVKAVRPADAPVQAVRKEAAPAVSAVPPMAAAQAPIPAAVAAAPCSYNPQAESAAAFEPPAALPPEPQPAAVDPVTADSGTADSGEAEPNPAAAVSSLLQQASALHAQGILTDEEYAAKCRQILSRLEH